MVRPLLILLSGIKNDIGSVNYFDNCYLVYSLGEIMYPSIDNMKCQVCGEKACGWNIIGAFCKTGHMQISDSLNKRMALNKDIDFHNLSTLEKCRKINEDGRAIVIEGVIMIHENCLFCKVRSGVQETRIKDSAKNNNLEVLALDGENCLLKFKGSVPALPSFISRLKNTMLFSSVIFSGSAYVSE